jgi:hypothetical protein
MLSWADAEVAVATNMIAKSTLPIVIESPLHNDVLT